MDAEYTLGCCWCGQLNTLPPQTCPVCGHQLGIPRLQCSCPKCRTMEAYITNGEIARSDALSDDILVVLDDSAAAMDAPENTTAPIFGQQPRLRPLLLLLLSWLRITREVQTSHVSPFAGLWRLTAALERMIHRIGSDAPAERPSGQTADDFDAEECATSTVAIAAAVVAELCDRGFQTMAAELSKMFLHEQGIDSCYKGRVAETTHPPAGAGEYHVIGFTGRGPRRSTGAE